MEFAQTGDLKEGFYNMIDELDEAFYQRANNLETEIVKKFSDKRRFYEYLKVHEEVCNILTKNNVDENIIKEIKDELNKQTSLFSDEMVFFSNYYFKAGAMYGAKIYLQLSDCMNNKDNTIIN